MVFIPKSAKVCEYSRLHFLANRSADRNEGELTFS
jgi:hypothetical protein